jgi:hypothetical protein
MTATLALARVAVADRDELLRAESEGRYPSLVREELGLPVRSGKDLVALLLEAAEDLCLEEVRQGEHLIAASDVRPFLVPRLAELLDPENEELRFVLAVEGKEGVSEHAIQRAVSKGEWPQNGSATLEAAVLAVKLAAVAGRAGASGESILVAWRH